jgi:rhodanese-related sulfurtransferase
MTLPLEISPQEVKLRLESGEKLHLIDVREPHEFAQARLQGADLIPMRTVPGELPALEARAEEGTLVVYCHHGIRSLNVVSWLREQGVEACQSMAGGIEAWSLTVDPSVPRYS